MKYSASATDQSFNNPPEKVYRKTSKASNPRDLVTPEDIVTTSAVPEVATPQTAVPASQEPTELVTPEDIVTTSAVPEVTTPQVDVPASQEPTELVTPEDIVTTSAVPEVTTPQVDVPAHEEPLKLVTPEDIVTTSDVPEVATPQTAVPATEEPLKLVTPEDIVTTSDVPQVTTPQVDVPTSENVAVDELESPSGTMVVKPGESSGLEQAILSAKDKKVIQPWTGDEPDEETPGPNIISDPLSPDVVISETGANSPERLPQQDTTILDPPTPGSVGWYQMYPRI